ncbi:ParB/RepB/Spo0J family partition protein [Methanosarcina mazei]|uniref:ParB/Sulfiredoxin domain-containing protein n=2 Tax=Methanosarcina mazei TaxID=2209 RepID=A0A6C0VII2_METMZ|nr:ParB/RepB/Spo0J family partition protein [Methanosarcina mazei]AKB61368.1 Ribosome recycling factor [Methanosarcina mazei SarPi]QIB90985.1 hypothetical protein FQU78_07895 [Methanosarcina mazei]
MVIVDPELKKLIVALASEERERLKNSIMENGFNPAFPVILWKGHDTIVDGHNRWEICQELGVEPEIIEQEFETKEDVMIWMVKNQLARRNLTPDQYSKLRGSRYNVEKAAWGKVKGKSCTSRTDERLSMEYGVSPRTIKNDGKFAAAVEKICTVCTIEENDLVGKFKKSDIMELGELPDNKIEKGLEKLKAGGKVKSKPEGTCPYYLQFNSSTNEKILEMSAGNPQEFFLDLINAEYERRHT